jgi:hypothetical protein
MEEKDSNIDLSNRLRFHVAEAKRNPQDISYWENPQVDLIGIKIKKNFGTQGIFSGTIIEWAKPYFRVLYVDGDQEEISLKDILLLIDVAFVRRLDGDRKDDLQSQFEDPIEEGGDRGQADSLADDVNSIADSKSSRGRSSSSSIHAEVNAVTVLT